MNIINRLLSTSLLLIPMYGCEFAYGVRHEARLNSLPPIECIKLTLQEIDEIQNVRYDLSYSGKPIRLSGIKDPDTQHNFHYKHEDISIFMRVSQNYKGEVNFYQSDLYMNYKPPQITIDKAREIMKLVEERLEDQCRLSELSSNVNEECIRVDCK